MQLLDALGNECGLEIDFKQLIVTSKSDKAIVFEHVNFQSGLLPFKDIGSQRGSFRAP